MFYSVSDKHLSLNLEIRYCRCTNLFKCVAYVCILYSILVIEDVETKEHLSSDICTPSKSCSPPCKPTDSCSELPSKERSSLECPCKNTTCYSLLNHCLFTCAEQDIKNVLPCANCLSNIDHVKGLNSNTTHTTRCQPACEGMCPDLNCELTLRTNITSQCINCKTKVVNRLCVDDNCTDGCYGGCHKESGYCKHCEAGTYGPKCEHYCSPSCNNSECSTESGACKGCVPGYMGKYCDITCPAGQHGSGCDKACSTNCVSRNCDPRSGACIDGCEPGYFGLHCSKECPIGSYGQDCLSKCPFTCKAGQICHHTTGSCESGCISGFTGTQCNETCPERTYGPNCMLNCSTLCFRQLCNAYSGICLTCEEGYYGPHCQFIVHRKIKHGVLGSELNSNEALMLVLGIALFGALMWLSIAYLFMLQRKQILHDASLGIDPRRYQFGAHPHAGGIRKAFDIYSKKVGKLASGHTKDAPNRRKRNDQDDEYNELERMKREFRRRGRLSQINRRKGEAFEPYWWTYPDGDKPSLPDDDDVEKVTQWLSYHHGITLPRRSANTARVVDSRPEHRDDGVCTEPIISHTKRDTSGTTSVPYSQDMMRSVSRSQSAIETAPTKHSDTLEKTTDPSSETSQKNSPHSADADAETQQTATVESKSLQAGLRRDAVVLSPIPYEGGRILELAPKLRRDTSRVQWLKDKGFTSDSTTRNTTYTDSRRETTTPSTSAYSSKHDSLSSTSDSSSSSEETATETNPTSKTLGGSSSTEETTYSYSSDSSTEEGTSSSTVTSRTKTLSVQKRSITEKGHSKPQTEDVTATANVTTEPVGLLQKIVSAFRRKPSGDDGIPPLPPQTIKPTYTSSRGSTQPFSYKFLFNRMDPWGTNRGLEVTPNAGMLDVAGGSGMSTTTAPNVYRNMHNDRTASHLQLTSSDEGAWESTSTRNTTENDENQTTTTRSKPSFVTSTTGSTLEYVTSSTLESEDIE